MNAAVLGVARLTYAWSVPEQMPVEQMESGRRLTVAPTQVEIWVDRGSHGWITVGLRGPRINRDGSRGGQKTAFFTDGDSWYGEDLARLPSWAHRYVDAVRAAEAATAALP